MMPIDPAMQGVFDTYERRIAEQEQTIAALTQKLSQTEKARDNYFVEAERNMGTAASLQRELDALRERNAAHEKVLDALNVSGLNQSVREAVMQMRLDRALSELAAAWKALEPFAKAWDEFEWESLDGKPKAKDRINGELDCSLDIQVKHWRAAARAQAKDPQGDPAPEGGR